MKTLLFALALVILGWRPVGAQVSVEVVMTQQQYLPGESLPAAVKITNRSGQRMTLGTEPNWLTFSVESVDGFVVLKNAEVPVLGEFELESSQMGTKRVDLAPWFTLARPGRYKVVATLRIKDWFAEEASSPAFFEIVKGSILWSQQFGLPAGTNLPPVPREYSLVKANYLQTQMRLYVQVSSPENGRIIAVTPVGSLVSFSQPEGQVDGLGFLHVLYQDGAATFAYTLIAPDGSSLNREVYDYVNSRPRLALDNDGSVTVRGGVRRLKAKEMPPVKMPAELLNPAHP